MAEGDIAVLGLRIDSAGVETASQRLDTLVQSSELTATATEKLLQETIRLQKEMAKVATATKATEKAAAETARAMNAMGSAVGDMARIMAQAAGLPPSLASGLDKVVTAALSAKKASGGLQTALKGFAKAAPLAVVTALAGTLYSLAAAQSESEKIAEKYGLTMERVKKSLLDAKDGADSAAAGISNIAKAFALAELPKLESSLAKIRTEIKLLSVDAAAGYVTSSVSTASEDLIEAVAQIEAIQESYRKAGISAKDASEQIAAIHLEMYKSGEASSSFTKTIADLLMKLAAAAEQEKRLADNNKILNGVFEDTSRVMKEVAAAAGALSSLENTFSRVFRPLEEFNAQSLAAEMEKIRAAIKTITDDGERFAASFKASMLEAAASAGNFASLNAYAAGRAELSAKLKEIELGEVEYRQWAAERKLASMRAALEAERDAAEKELQLRGQVLLSLQNVTSAKLAMHQAEVDAAQKMVDNANQLLASFEKNYQKLLASFAGSGKTGGFSEASKQAREFETAVKAIDDEIARLTKDEKEYAEYTFSKKRAEWEKLGVPIQKINELIAAQQAAESNLNTQKVFDEAANALKDFEKEYQAALGGSRDLTESIVAEMDAFRKAAQVAYQKGKMGAEKYEAVLKRINELEAKKLRNVSKDPADGFKRSVEKYVEQAKDLAKQTEEAFTGLFNGLDSGFKSMWEGMIEDGKLSLKSLKKTFTNFLAELAHMAITRPIVVSVVQSMGGLLGNSQNAYAGAGGMGGMGGMGTGNLIGSALSLGESALNWFGSSSYTGAMSPISTGATGIGQVYPTLNTLPTTGAMSAVNIGGINSVGQVYPTMNTIGTPGSPASSGLGAASSALGYLGAGVSGYFTGQSFYEGTGAKWGLPQGRETDWASGLGGAVGGIGGMMAGTAIASSAAMAGSALATGATFGSVIPGIGTMIGAAIGAIVGGLAGSLGGKERELRVYAGMRTNLADPGAYLQTDGSQQAMHDAFSYGAYTKGDFLGDWGAINIKGSTGHSAYYIDPVHAGGDGDEIASAIEPQIREVEKTLLEMSKMVTESLPEQLRKQFTQELSTRPLALEYKFKPGDLDDEGIQEWVGNWVGLTQGVMTEAFAQLDFSEWKDKITVNTDDWSGVELFVGAIQAIEDVERATRELSEPTTDWVARAKEANAQLDAWAYSLRQYGVTQEYATELMDGYRTGYVDKLIRDFQETIHPTAQLTTALEEQRRQVNGWIDALRELKASEEQIADAERARADALQQISMAYLQEINRDLRLRTMALQKGTDSSAYQVQALQYQQARELQEAAAKYGKDSGAYSSLVEVQQAELAQLKVSLLEKELEKALAAQKQAAQSAVSTAQRLKSAFDGVLDSLRDFRRDLWTGESNLVGTRYKDALSEFNALYDRAMTGDAEAMGELSGLGNTLLQLARDQIGTYGEYNDLFYEVDRKLKEAQDYAAEQVGGQDSILATLEQQLAALNAQTAASEYTGRSADAIRLELEMLRAQLEKEKTDIAGPASLSQREALLQAKADQLNDMAYQGRADWTANAALAAIYKAGMSLESWYDKYGKWENLDVAYDSNAARQSILANKARQLNEMALHGRTDWTPQSTLDEINRQGMTLDEWFIRYGLSEGISSGYYSRTGDAQAKNAAGLNKTVSSGLRGVDKGLDAQLEATKNLGNGLDGLGASWADEMGALGSTIGGALGALSSSVAGLDWNVTVNVNGGGSAAVTPGGSGSSGSGSSGGPDAYTGVYGSRYATVYDLLQAKANAMNEGRTLTPDLSPGGWNVSNVREEIAKNGISVAEWYERYGKAEGFAAGGVTPVNEPFWVGENGPELVMSPRQWGVLSNEDSLSLLRSGTARPDRSGADNAELVRELREIKGFLRQIIVKTDKTAYACDKVLGLCRMWDAEGMPAPVAPATA